MLLIFVEKISSRLKYAFNLVLREVLQVKFSLTTNREEFDEFEGPKFTYHSHSLGKEFFIQSHSLLFENGIIEQEITPCQKGDLTGFFPCSKRSNFEFDVFACSFYMAVRYEEYLPHKRDGNDRFEAEQSVATELNVLKQPIVNQWCEAFWDVLSAEFPSLQRKQREFKLVTTIDIDNAFLYREKGLVRTIAGYLSDLIHLNFSSIQQRTSVLLGKSTDPYDTYEYQLDLIKKHKNQFIYFLLLGDYGVNDKNIPISNDKFQALIKHLADYAQVGIHPSFGSHTSFAKLEKEVLRLSPILNREITQSRQHFLQLKFPDTYRDLIDLDILNDYTMGYATHYGFRSGMCTPYYFYDLDLEVETRLVIHPFAVSETTLQYHMGIPAEKAIDHLKKLMEEVKKVNGTFISIWHNDTLTNRGKWKGWRNVFEEVLEYGKS